MAKKPRVPAKLRRLVQERAGGTCEYCRIHEDDMLFSYEADHIIAEKHHGTMTLDNLAWACGICNRFKGTDIASVDPETGNIVPLFNPRKQQWGRHFRLNGLRIAPFTASGRATEVLLQLNADDRLIQRQALMSQGRYPLPHN
jgi:hypothetical protein